ncbi:helix-turn-helix transcriptional regulator [Psychrobacter sp. UBA3480]|uniref:helix-turn-helix domain-containing protein n=1 Tax=Psychrobacter sp. UBA3480 TaxID=1947350 RepID=UPI0025DDE026|nr:helix-turn-helix transcriptional regulator [Psychrobacter sp. UBA3480]
MKNTTDKKIQISDSDIKAMHGNLILNPPADNKEAGKTIMKYLEKTDLTAIELGEIMGFGKRSRVSMLEFEHGRVKIKPITYTLFAIALGFHPALPEKFDLKNKLVFTVNETEDVDYALWLREALDERGLEPGNMFDHLSAAGQKSRSVPADVIEKILSGEYEPLAREWGFIQLALDKFVSGFDYPKSIREYRESIGDSQPNFALKVGLGGQTIGNYETNVMLPADHVWAVIMLALDMHPSFSMLTGNKDDAPLNEVAAADVA